MRYTFPCVCYCVLSLLFACAFSQEKFKLDIAIEQNALDVDLDKDFSKAGTTEKPIPVKTVSSTISTVIKSTTSTLTENVPGKPPRLVCPGKEVRRPFFSLPCAATQDCGFLGRGMVCCNRRCIKGVPPPIPEPTHEPTFFGFVERICPINPLPEIWEIKECKRDSDCAPRICCPETLRSGENVSYCRTAQAVWDKIPAAKQFVQPINNLVSYMQCTPPPPPLLDIFPKPCQNPLDCFPNLCCQEGGKRYCRPPRRSLFALIAGVGQRLVPANAARRFIERITSTSRGTLIFNTDKPNNIQSAKSEENTEVTALLFGRNENELLVGYENGCVNIYDTVERKYIKTPKLEGEGRVVGIGCANKAIVIGKHDGIINVWNGKRNNYFDIHLDEKGTLDALVYNENRRGVVGSGGEFNDLKLWDIETQQCIFKAKSLGHDMLNLPIPTSVRGITFFPEDSYLSVCATKEGYVLLYDDRAQRRPVVTFLEKKASYTTIACAYRERQCLVGTARGYMQMLDMKTGKSLRTFTSFTGSVTSIVCDPLEPYVISTSLDRHLRIHNLETKELLHKVYMKQNLTKVLIKPVVKDEPTEEKNEDEEKVDEEYEEIFKNMQTVVSSKKLKKQKRNSEDIIEKPRRKKKKKVKQTED